MNMSKERLMRLAERALKRTESYQWNRGLDVPDEENYKIDYLLVKGSKASPEDVVAYAGGTSPDHRASLCAGEKQPSKAEGRSAGPGGVYRRHGG